MDKERSEQWFSFLQEESIRQNGLLCFYEPEKSQEVAHCCGILSKHLEAFLDEDWVAEKGENGGEKSS
jgi:hypothetical protein